MRPLPLLEGQRKSCAILSVCFRQSPYCNNQRHRLDYPGFLAAGRPIGSGVTEAAGEAPVKQRLCVSGMRWTSNGAKIVLNLRALTHRVGRWTRFSQRINEFGAECFC